jgi:hypothetical protein
MSFVTIIITVITTIFVLVGIKWICVRHGKIQRAQKATLSAMQEKRFNELVELYPTLFDPKLYKLDYYVRPTETNDGQLYRCNIEHTQTHDFFIHFLHIIQRIFLMLFK